MLYLLLLALGLFTTQINAKLTVKQAHTALTHFIQKTPDSPANTRIITIIKALEEHLPTNPNGTLQAKHVDEIKSILTLAHKRTAESNTLENSLPFLIKIGTILLVALFLKKQFWPSTDISRQLSAVQQENAGLHTKLTEIEDQLEKLTRDNTKFTTLIKSAGDMILKIEKQFITVIRRQQEQLTQLIERLNNLNRPGRA